MTDEAKRINTARAIISTGQPVPFVAESVLQEGTARRQKGRQETSPSDQTRIVVESYVKAAGVRELIATRMSTFAHEHSPLCMQMPADTPRVLLAWALHGAPGETDTYLKEIFERDPQSVFPFLTCYLTPMKSLTTGRKGYNDFDQNAYDAIRSVVNPNIVMETLHRLFDFDTDRQRATWGAEPDEHLADRFEQIHAARILNAAQDPQPPDAMQPTQAPDESPPLNGDAVVEGDDDQSAP
jgi:hypothetical protein